MSISGSGFGDLQSWTIDPETQAYIDTQRRLQSLLSEPLPLDHKFMPRIDAGAQSAIDELLRTGVLEVMGNHLRRIKTGKE